MTWVHIVIGLVAGICGGFFGIGGATVIVPALVLFLGFSQHQAQGTTLAAMIPPIGLLAALRYYQQGNVKISAALFIALGFFIGAYFGAQLVEKVPDILLKRLFGCFLLIIAVRLILTK
ncbi:MAG: sulfite exporter TauE/SafE family protein [PVC group bacterium]|nr:sulfite exporter TauE/SafE family protein [PVC group bacterium]